MIRRLSFVLGRNTNFAPSAASRPLLVETPAIESRLNRTMRRWLSDDLAHMIRRACLSGHVNTAEALLGVLQGLIVQERQQFPLCRRTGYQDLVANLANEITAARQRRHGRSRLNGDPSVVVQLPADHSEKLLLADAAD